MKTYVELNGHTNTRAQFLARVRAALRATNTDCYVSWIDYIDGACEEMDEIASGKRARYYHYHKADSDSNFDELCAASATAYQIYLKRKDERQFYNFNLEWDDGHGYFYCIDSAIA